MIYVTRESLSAACCSVFKSDDWRNWHFEVNSEQFADAILAALSSEAAVQEPQLTETWEEMKQRIGDALPRHDGGCRCWPHVSEKDALLAVEAAALNEYRDGLRRVAPPAPDLAEAYEQGRRETLERMRAMRVDYRTMPHAEFPAKWPDWRDYEEVLPSYCGCKDCQLWRSGS